MSSDKRSSLSSSHSNTSAVTIDSSDSGVSSQKRKQKIEFKLKSYVTEKTQTPLYGIAFNNYLKPGQPKIFAVCGKTRCSVYECTLDGQIKLLNCFADPTEVLDTNKPKKKSKEASIDDRRIEDFWTCCWSLDSATKRSILITAGIRGVIRLLRPEDADWYKSAKALIGHGQAINQLKVSLNLPFLLASASSDRSIRLWNIETGICIVSFHAEEAHRDGVLTIDFNQDTTKLVSGGFDHLLAIWDLTVPEIKKAIENSQHYDKEKSKLPKIILQSFPILRNRNIHSNYIDCVQWFGDLILSKACENDFFCWAPRILADDVPITNPKNVCTIVATFKVRNATYHYERFATNSDMSLMAFGNDIGEVFVYDLGSDNPAKIPQIVLKHPKRKQTVRDVSFSRSGNELVVCTDGGTIWYYQRQM